MTEWSQRFVLFAKSEGKTPEDLYAEETTAGQRPMSFRFREFIDDARKKFHDARHPEHPLDCVIFCHRKEFEEFLDKEYADA
jgi:hypothetical protein